MNIEPLDPYSVVVDEKQKWTPEWYRWLVQLTNSVVIKKEEGDGTEGSILDVFQFTKPVALLAGFSAGSYDINRFFVNWGMLASVADQGPTLPNGAIYSSNQDSLPYMIDTGTTGIQSWSGDPDPSNPSGQKFVKLLGGMVEGASPNSGDAVYPFVVRNTSKEDLNLLSVMGTTHLDYAYLASHTPAPWIPVRYLPFSVKYILGRDVNWNGLPTSFLVDPYDNLTVLPLSTDSNVYLVGGGGFTGSGSVYVGDLIDVNTVRMVLLRFNVSHDGVTAGKGIAKIGRFTVGQVGIGDNVYGEMLVVIDSGATFPFLCDTGVVLTMWLKGWRYMEIP